MACWSKSHAATIAESVRKQWQSISDERREELRLTNIEIRVGGFWYGSVINDKKPTNPYCAKWNPYLRERIRAFWGHVSVLSGEPETCVSTTGKPIAISCHHVYYQKSACCFWDEDEKGYYVNLNTVASKRYPKFERYYIEDGNPNKFVTLTKHEHRRTETDKIKWIKLFEQIIADNGGKCYLTDNDVAEMQVAESTEILA